MVLIWKTLYKRACGREMKSSEPSPFLPLKSEIEILREFFLQVANEQTPENFLDTRCNVGASKNAVTHFLRSDYLYIWYLKVFGGRLPGQLQKISKSPISDSESLMDHKLSSGIHSS